MQLKLLMPLKPDSSKRTMFDRLLLSVLLATVGWNGLYPDPPVPLTLKQKAKNKSMSAVCIKKKQTKTVKEMCQQWEKNK
jgi:hypothetical protein